MKNGNLDLASLSAQASILLKSLRAYRVLIFFLTVASCYGFIVWRINVYSNTPANQSEETAQATSQPHVDPATVQKILNLQSNSVSVQTLFNEARQNPFQE
jgi:hypothetical protein